MLNSGKKYNLMLHSGPKKNILTLELSETVFLNETKKHKLPPLQVKWSVPKGSNRNNFICFIF